MAKKTKAIPEFALVGDVDDWERDALQDLLGVKPGSECAFYIDSSGGSVYGVLALLTLIRLRKLKVTSYVLGECSSAMLLVFAASHRRYVTPYSTLFFHRMRWQSDKRVDSVEARHWASHFEQLETELETLEAKLFGESARGKVKEWITQARFLSGREIAEAGLAELIEV